MTRAPAALFGLRDRGVLAPGARADVVCFDPDTVGTGDVSLVADLPGGTERLFAPALGLPHVLVNGTAIVRDGTPTDALPGTVLRAGRDTATVAIPAGA
jgi:N-acyl-D-aspartate/D-glutamate deacylase